MSLRDRLEELERRETPIRVGLVGAGQMGRGLVAQVGYIPGMEVVAAADVDLERAVGALRETGREPVEGPDGRAGRPAATHDPMEIVRSDSVDVVVEATGIVEVGARVVYEAIHNGKQVVMLNVETEVTVGALLGRMARSAGVVYTDHTTSSTDRTISRASRRPSPWPAPPSTASLPSSAVRRRHRRSWPWRSGT